MIMKKIILTLIALVACGLVAYAATKYEINIAGTEVTSDNASYIGASSDNDIRSGYAVYNASANTLTCYNLYIRRSGNGSYGIHNRKCDNLTIVFKGDCGVAAADHALNLARSTTITVDEGSSVEVITGGGAHALNLGSYTYYIKGVGLLDLFGKNAIHGNGSGSTTVYFQGAKVKAQGSDNNHALESFKAVFNEGADLKISANGNMTSVNNVSMYFYGKETVLAPYGAYYSNSAIYDSSGSQVTNETIYISDNYVAIINEDNFPDFYFRNSMLSLYSKGYITQTDVDNRTSLNISYKGIYDLTGLSYFNKLTSLDCNHNNIKSLPSLPSTLTELNCDHNQLTSLPSLPTGLVTLYCGNNSFTTLTITGRNALKTLYAQSNKSMTSLNCNGNFLFTLDVSGCSALKSLYCQNNQLTSLGTLPNSIQEIYCGSNKFKSLDVSNITSLQTLNCPSNQLTSLNVNGCTALISLVCNDNLLTSLGTLPNSIQSIDCSNNQFSNLTINGKSALAELNASGNTTMSKLNCDNNALTTLNVDNCTALKKLYCSANQLTLLGTLPDAIEVVDASDNNFTGTMTITGKSALKTLNVANNPLTKLECYSNALTALAIGGCTELAYLNCSNNKLASLDVRGLKKLATLYAYKNGMTSFYGTYCSALKYLWLCYNNLTSLDLTGCSALSELWIQKNQIKDAAMTSLINSLRTIPTSESEGMLGVFEPSYTGMAEGNQITNAQNMAARAKRWIPKQYNSGWQEIPLKGDVNGDGKINVSDVTVLVNMILGTIPKDLARGDINGDGSVNVSDVTALVNIILGQG